MAKKEYVDLDAAAAAFEAMQGDDEDDDSVGVEPGTEQAPVAEAPSAPEPTAEAPEAEEEFIPRADLEALLEGVSDPAAREAISTAYKSFQRGFTQANQRVSGMRRALEDVDPVKAREAYDFVQNLTNNRDFAIQVHSELQAALEAAGHSPASASAEASRQMEDAITAGDEYVDPDDALAREVRELKEWRKQSEARAAESERQREQDRIIAGIERAEQAIRRDNPSYQDDDIETIYKIATSTGGDLMAAQEQYEALRDRLVTDYVASKKKVPAGVQPVSPGAPTSETPVEITSIKQAHELAKERAKHLLAGE